MAIAIEGAGTRRSILARVSPRIVQTDGFRCAAPIYILYGER
jgi:hypothetical protein